MRQGSNRLGVTTASTRRAGKSRVRDAWRPALNSGQNPVPKSFTLVLAHIFN